MDFNTTCSVLTVRKASATVKVFSFPKCTSYVSNRVIVTTFERPLKRSLHLPKMFPSLLCKTQSGYMMDLAASNLLQDARCFCKTPYWLANNLNPASKNSLNITFSIFSLQRLQTFVLQHTMNGKKIQLCSESMPWKVTFFVQIACFHLLIPLQG